MDRDVVLKAIRSVILKAKPEGSPVQEIPAVGGSASGGLRLTPFAQDDTAL
jgi:hypothetical protein